MKTKNLLLEVAFMLTLTILLQALTLAQGTWTRKADFPGEERFFAVSFSIGTKGYVGLGYNYNDVVMKDFWEWDQAINVWTRLADFPGRIGGAVSFSIGSKGYLGTGYNYDISSNTNEFWEYDPATNSWTQKAPLPSTGGRYLAVGFSIGNKGYIGLGEEEEVNHYYQDFWEYDQATNVWTKKADYKGDSRSGTVGFSIGNKGYIGTGYNGTNVSKEFWEWDQETNSWTQKADFGGSGRQAASCFSIGNKGYIGTGNNSNRLTKDFWEWNQTNNTWTKKADFTGFSGNGGLGFSINNKGYIGTGFGGPVVYASKDFWEFDPLETTGIDELVKENSAFYPNPAFDIININFNNQNNAESTLNIYSVTGEIVKSELLKQNQQQFNVADLRNGIYMIEVKSNTWSKKQKLLIQR